MPQLSKPLFRPMLALLMLVIALPVLATVKNIEPGTAFTPLEPTSEQSMTTQQVLNNLMRGHYESKKIDNELSSHILDILLKDIDSTHSYLLASDVKEFEPYRHQLDDALKRGDMRPAFFIYNRFQQRVNERLAFLLKELDKHAADYKYDLDERLELNRENAVWAETTAELDDLWRKRLKNSILNLRNAKKENKDSIELLSKRYQNQLNRLHQATSEDAYQTFMNAVTRSFDPHTQYLSPRSTENFNINMSLSLQGIGAVLQSEDEYTKVVSLVPAGPASKADNLKPADKILGVGQGDKNIVDVIGWRLDEVVELIRGPKGSTVRLEIQPANGADGETKVISIVRDEVKLEEQAAQKNILEVNKNGKKHRIGIIDIPTFYIDFQGRMENKPDYTSTTRDVAKLISELKEEGIDGLIIDLRNNGGGSLEEAINLTGLFINMGPVVQVRSISGHVEVLPDLDPNVLYDGPLTVMVNRLSASASEIFAGAIQDYGRGLIVGSQTFGKGTVQSLRPLRSGQLKITQAKFYRISGDSTQHKGVLPDIQFPSIFDNEKIGESSLEDSMPWDSIRPTQYQYSTLISQELPTLQKLHKKRIKNNPDFLYLNKQKELIEELRQQTQISLNEKVRKTERDKNDKKRLSIENERRKAKDMPLLSSLDELDELNLEEADSDTVKTPAKESKDGKKSDKKDGDTSTDDKNTKAKDKKAEDDALLVESAHILLDYTDLHSIKTMTAQQQKKGVN